MLGQMRLAWWRDALGTSPQDRPRGDAVLDAIGTHWAGREAALIAMVDGWEVLVVAERLGPDEAQAFASGRGAFFGALAGDCTSAQASRIAAAGARWALADAAAAVSDDDERALLVQAGQTQGRPEPSGSGRMPRDLRGLAVLEALAVRALQRGGRPLMEGRGAPLAVLRAAIFLT
jgi:phytoene synthase